MGRAFSPPRTPDAGRARLTRAANEGPSRSTGAAAHGPGDGISPSLVLSPPSKAKFTWKTVPYAAPLLYTILGRAASRISPSNIKREANAFPATERAPMHPPFQVPGETGKKQLFSILGYAVPREAAAASDISR